MVYLPFGFLTVCASHLAEDDTMLQASKIRGLSSQWKHARNEPTELDPSASKFALDIQQDDDPGEVLNGTKDVVVCHGCVDAGHCVPGFDRLGCVEAGYMWRQEDHSKDVAANEVFEFKQPNSLDADGDGFISIEDLATVVMEMGDPRPTEMQMELLKSQLQYFQDVPLEVIPEDEALVQTFGNESLNASFWGAVVNVVSHSIGFVAHTVQGGSPEQYVLNQLKDPWFWAGVAGFAGGKHASKAVRAGAAGLGFAADINTFFGTVSNAVSIAKAMGGPRRRRASAAENRYFQSLRRRRTGSINTRDPRAFQLKNVGANKCIQIAGGGHGYQNQPITTWDCTGGYNLMWKWHGQQLKNPATGKCLHIAGGDKRNNGKITLYDCVNSWNLKWVKEGNYIRNPGANKCLHIAGGDKRKKARITTYTCVNSWNVQFQIV